MQLSAFVHLPNILVVSLNVKKFFIRIFENDIILIDEIAHNYPSDSHSFDFVSDSPHVHVSGCISHIIKFVIGLLNNPANHMWHGQTLVPRGIRKTDTPQRLWL